MSSVKYYCSTTDVYNKAGIDSSIISTTDVIDFIVENEEYVDNVTYTTYWQLSVSSSVTTGTTSSIDTTGLNSEEHVGNVIYLNSGYGKGQYRMITDNTSTTVTVDRDWETVPTSTTNFQIFHCGSVPFVNEYQDGDGQYTTFTERYPIINIESITIGSTTVSTTNTYKYLDTGQITLKSGAEYTNLKPGNQTVNFKYWYGVKDKYKNNAPNLVKKYTSICAAITVLTSQIGGTFDDVTSFSIGPMQGSLGEPYTNIRETISNLIRERDRLHNRLTKYLNTY